ncbi:MAG: hypothetical protein IKN44_05215 [Bacteroidaceae bacterium]|nr:hypothetical protein [Bacteroidaceae bacterium]MBR3619136.1 hypothetical protein [Bacteroidaceae bacterium]
MITLELSRFYGAPGYTWGTMKESLTGFSCWTMERHDPNHWRGMKNYCAIPAGQYRLRVTTRDNLKLNLRLLIPGTYRKAELTNACVPNDQPAGSICVGKKIDRERKALEGGDVVLDGIDTWIRRLMNDGHISTKMRTGEIRLLVKYADGYYYDHQAKNKEEETNDAEQDVRFDFAE